MNEPETVTDEDAIELDEPDPNEPDEDESDAVVPGEQDD